MKMKLLAIAGVFVFVFTISTNHVSASEGQFELKNQVGESARCWAASVLMQDLKYQILVSCRDIVYPGGTEVFSYVVWATQPDGGVTKLGTLGLGKAQFSTNKPFVNMYVTKEIDPKTRSPQGPTVMSGGLEHIALLENPNLAQDETSELGEPTTSPTPAPVRKSNVNFFRIGGAVAFILLFLVILLILAITRR
jgi:hypothetical protein